MGNKLIIHGLRINKSKLFYSIKTDIPLQHNLKELIEPSLELPAQPMMVSLGTKALDLTDVVKPSVDEDL